MQAPDESIIAPAKMAPTPEVGKSDWLETVGRDVFWDELSQMEAKIIEKMTTLK